MTDKTFRAYRVSTPATGLPVSLAEARAHLRAEGITYDNDLIEAYIRAAAGAVETSYSLALLTQTVVQTHTGFPESGDAFFFRVRPVVSITSIAYIDSDGVSQTWANTNYEAEGLNSPIGFPSLWTKFEKEYPVAASVPNAVTITYQAGFGADSTSVPANIRLAMLHMVADMYESREDKARTLPTVSKALLRTYYNYSP